MKLFTTCINPRNAKKVEIGALAESEPYRPELFHLKFCLVFGQVFPIELVEYRADETKPARPISFSSKDPRPNLW
jgi:hypothetical protein